MDANPDLAEPWFLARARVHFQHVGAARSGNDDSAQGVGCSEVRRDWGSDDDAVATALCPFLAFP